LVLSPEDEEASGVFVEVGVVGVVEGVFVVSPSDLVLLSGTTLDDGSLSLLS